MHRNNRGPPPSPTPRSARFYPPPSPALHRGYPLPSPSPSRIIHAGGRPVSRNLWVGNLFHHVSEAEFEELFIGYGELESIAFQGGRSYAFVNYLRVDDAVEAIKGLQGFMLAGYPLKIEFAKPEKAPRDPEYQRRDNRRSAERVSSVVPRDQRARVSSHEPYYPEKSRSGDKDAEPCEILWIGFPASLNVDEMALRRAFSPFGEIEKITAFTGRTYAFVQFRNVISAIRAKEALDGNLFDSPRVHICFAKREGGPSEQGKGLSNVSSPRFSSRERSTEFRAPRSFGSSTPYGESPHIMSDMGSSGDFGYDGFNRKVSPWAGGSSTFEHMRMHGPGPEQSFTDDFLENRKSIERTSHRNEYSPSRFHPRSPLPDDPSEFGDDDFPFHQAKKSKIGQFPRDRKPPEYPIFDSGPKKQPTILSTFSGLPEPDTYDKGFGSSAGSLTSNRFSDNLLNSGRPLDIDGSWKPANRFEAGSASLPTNSNTIKLQAFAPESDQSSKSGEWKWEGTIAKGGTPVCRARCFPVGKLLDITLPEFLNCTARTGLDMLEKHFYQAASAYVVFFVPGSDADVVLYNEFLNYLGEKQRAAVAKLGEKITLFLVPPSEFSEKVLKVPGNVSISGVILKFDQATGSDFGPLMDSKLTSFNEDIVSYTEPAPPDLKPSTFGQNQSYLTNSSSQSFPRLAQIPTAAAAKLGLQQPSYTGTNMPVSGLAVSGSYSSSIAPEPFNEKRYVQLVANQTQTQTQTHIQTQNQNPSYKTSINPPLLPTPPQQPSWPVPQPQNLSAVAAQSSDTANKTSSSSYMPGVVDKYCYQESSSDMPPHIPLLEPEQLVHLANLLGKRKLQSSSGNNGPPGFQMAQSFRPNQGQGSSSSVSVSQFSQSLQAQQSTGSKSSNATAQQEHQSQSQIQTNQESGGGVGGEERDGDPQKRLQATLQLAAALLQQIQQQQPKV